MIFAQKVMLIERIILIFTCGVFLTWVEALYIKIPFYTTISLKIGTKEKILAQLKQIKKCADLKSPQFIVNK